MSVLPLHTQPLSDLADSAPENAEQVRKRYESMSLDEMAQSMADNYKQLTEALGPRFAASRLSTDLSPLHASSDHSNDNDLDDDHDYTNESFVDRTDLDDAAKHARMNRLFSRAVSAGDTDRVKQLLSDNKLRPWIDINAKDQEGSTPLIDAACFNKVEMAQILLDNGAHTDIQDAMGWSALMWATRNGHEELVKMLMDHGASPQTKSTKGRTVYDFVSPENQKIGEILGSNRDSIFSESSFADRLASIASSASSVAGDTDFYYQASMDGFENFMAKDTEYRQQLMESMMAIAGHYDSQGSGDDDDSSDAGDSALGDSDQETADAENTEFDWDKCRPDQMFVFGVNNLSHILDTVICHVSLPVAARQELCVPANVVFLSARFAHYFSTSDLLHDVLDGAIQRITQIARQNARKVHVLAFWIKNLTQLLYYLKKDSSLVVATADYQLELSELISDVYTLLVNDTEKQLAKLLKPAMVDHDQIGSMENLIFADEWQRFFRRKSRASMMAAPDFHTVTQGQQRHADAPAMMQPKATPEDVTDVLSSVYRVLGEYEVHPTIIIQALAQFFHYISCELFNHMLSNKKLISRSKAVQVRLNLSEVENWVRNNKLPSNLSYYLNPFVQLLQFLQCLSQLNDLQVFVDTVKTFDALNALQIKRCVVNYRYEVDEERLPEAIEAYAHQAAAKTTRYRHARSLERKRQNLAILMSRTDSVPSLVDSMASYSLTESPSSLPSTPTMPAPPPFLSSDPYDHDVYDDDDDLKETKDTQFMLPFSVPSTAHMDNIHGWAPDTSKRHYEIPNIPENWMMKLDSGNNDTL